MIFATPVLYLTIFVCIGYGLMRLTRLGLIFHGRSGVIWTMAFAIGALGTAMSLGAVQLMR